MTRTADPRNGPNGIHASGPGGGQLLVELAHDSIIIEHWGRLRSWLHEEHDFRTWLDKINFRAQEWAKFCPENVARCDSALLLGEPQLQEAIERQVDRLSADLDAGTQGRAPHRRRGWTVVGD